MPEDDLTPEEEQVRRLLSDARHTEPIPADVAARLDEVLAGLRDEGPDETARTWPTPDELAAARRRRRVRTWLVAAAAVVVAGVGLNQVDWSGLGSGNDGASSSADSSAVSASDAGGDAAMPAVPEDAPSPAPWRAARLQLSAQRFHQQVQTFRKGAYLRSAAGQVDMGLSDGTHAYAPMCDTGKVGAGRRVPVRYDGARAWLVFRKPAGDTQVVDLYLCGGDEPARSVTLPAP